MLGKPNPWLLCRWRNWPGSSFTGPKQWLSFHRVSSRQPFDAASFFFLYIQPPWLYFFLSEEALLSLFQKFETKYNIYIKSFPCLFFWEGYYFCKNTERFSSLTLLHRLIFLCTVLMANSCCESLCEGIVRLPCPLNPQPFFLNCQQHQLVPHVVWICTGVLAAKSLKYIQKCKLALQTSSWVWAEGKKFKDCNVNISAFIPCTSWHALDL